ncbi:uncharacterized protein ELE39_000951 [Cryptosporidium sp. chipmunk genotype I]|uniref:uncharacterized protein n=1 Tax=Cryptosporidium sp. chipmunk genotype I TaxID=1280935 RepID=UPI00351A55A5|nr:hypothetical protein ELE39_000951 [Cryptosporidium sp. chipmunk genotype I]
MIREIRLDELKISLLQTNVKESLGYGYNPQESGGVPSHPYENRIILLEKYYDPTIVITLSQKYNDLFLGTLSKQCLEETQDLLVKFILHDISKCKHLEEKLEDELSVYLVDQEKYFQKIQQIEAKYKTLIFSEVKSINKYLEILLRIMIILLKRMFNHYREVLRSFII